MRITEIDLKEFDYELPSGQIAQFPLEKRDESKLLVFKDSKVNNDKFFNISEHIPDKSLIIFNNTKVIPARMLFCKDTGAIIEIFCLEPVRSFDHQTAMQQKGYSEWKCFIGNSKKWKRGKVNFNLERESFNFKITAEKTVQLEDSWVVRFEWHPENITFAEVLELTGHTPLPPYINRTDNGEDRFRYQTIYAVHNGSVAAPTAGLHFTETVFKELEKKGVSREYITLHVGAGTFKPVNTSISDHIMHSEPFIIYKEFLQNLTNNLNNTIIPVGTTSVRTIESIYWLGVKLIINGIEDFKWHIAQFDPYDKKYDKDISKREALEALINYLNINNYESITASTQLMILPSYRFVFPDAIITNFHQPKSTLLLLISALTGNAWKDIYSHAINNNFRFLSYGDSSLLWKTKKSFR
jgi:S-adenosylmethionine:tRNA ribosyltransferase-isomerase